MALFNRPFGRIRLGDAMDSRSSEANHAGSPSTVPNPLPLRLDAHRGDERLREYAVSALGRLRVSDEQGTLTPTDADMASPSRMPVAARFAQNTLAKTGAAQARASGQGRGAHPQRDRVAPQRPPMAPMTPALQERLRLMLPITRFQESPRGDRDTRGRIITSRKGAQGSMQVMPHTARDPGYGAAPASPGDKGRADFGERYLATMLQRFDGDPAKAWAAYNCGPARLNRIIAEYGEDWRSHLPSETRKYLDSTLPRLQAAEAEAARQRERGQPGSWIDPRWFWPNRKNRVNP